MPRYQMLRSALGSALTIVAVAAGSLAIASIPDANGTIHGCYRQDGSLRVIDAPGSTCRSGETPLDWNNTGPQGPQGIQGPPGPSGMMVAATTSNARFIPPFGCLHPYPALVITMELAQPTRLYASGHGQLVNEHLFDSDGTVFGRLNLVLYDSNLDPVAGHLGNYSSELRGPTSEQLTVAGFLRSANGALYVAQPGRYHLELIIGPGGTACAGAGDTELHDVSLDVMGM